MLFGAASVSLYVADNERCTGNADRYDTFFTIKTLVEQVKKRGRVGSKYIHKDNPEKVLLIVGNSKMQDITDVVRILRNFS